MRRSSQACCSGLRRIESPIFHRFSRSPRFPCHSRCLACIAIFACRRRLGASRAKSRDAIQVGGGSRCLPAAGFCRASATATTFCSSVCSSACGSCGLPARGRARGNSSPSSRHGPSRGSRSFRSCFAIAPFTHRSDSRATSERFARSAPTWLRCSTRRTTSRYGDGSMCSGEGRASCFQG